MSLEEFTTLVTQFVRSEFPIREIPLCYSSSIALQIDEIYSDRHYCMTFPEFIESLCRVVDIDSPAPVHEKVIMLFIMQIFLGNETRNESISTFSE